MLSGIFLFDCNEEKLMKTWEWSSKIFTIGLAVALLGGCATTYTPSSTAPSPPAVASPGPENPAPAENEATFLTVGPDDRTYIMHVENNTPFAARFPKARRVLYEKGFDQVRREREADFAVDVALSTEPRDNPDVRAQHLLGGAILGAAAGALLGAAGGRPVLGTIVGASSGAALGLAAPADTPMVRIDVRTESFRDGATSSKTVVVDMAHVPPYDVPRVIDFQVSRMLESLPSR